MASFSGSYMSASAYCFIAVAFKFFALECVCFHREGTSFTVIVLNSKNYL